jgi:hypothetical protein
MREREVPALYIVPALQLTPEQILAAVEVERKNPKHQAEMEAR